MRCERGDLRGHFNQLPLSLMVELNRTPGGQKPAPSGSRCPKLTRVIRSAPASARPACVVNAAICEGILTSRR
ncbi:hypothetical protein MAHJHV47_46720 [Mycobacterium avium subsp. hominissuis]